VSLAKKYLHFHKCRSGNYLKQQQIIFNYCWKSFIRAVPILSEFPLGGGVARSAGVVWNDSVSKHVTRSLQLRILSLLFSIDELRSTS